MVFLLDSNAVSDLMRENARVECFLIAVPQPSSWRVRRQTSFPCSPTSSHHFFYFTAHPWRTLRIDGMEWPAVLHPAPLVRKRRTGFGVVELDRRGRTLRLTGPERTLVDGFAAPWWVGGLDELVESAAGFRDLDLDLLDAYLKLVDRRVLDAATGWFLERHPEVSTGVSRLLARLEKRKPQQPLYLGGRRAGGHLQRRWNILVPPHLANSSFEVSS